MSSIQNSTQKSRKISVNKKLTYEEESCSILKYIHNSTIAELGISLNHTILQLSGIL